MSAARALRGAMLPVAIILAAGCHSYRAVPAGAPLTAESNVRVYAPLSELPVNLRRGDSPFVEGRVALWTPDSTRIAVPDPNFITTRATALAWRDTLTLATRTITHVERRQLDRGRTTALVAGLGVGVPIAVRALFRWARNHFDQVEDPTIPGPDPP
jgi:hypothetical protein